MRTPRYLAEESILKRAQSASMWARVSLILSIRSDEAMVQAGAKTHLRGWRCRPAYWAIAN
eukprot:7105779-Pyramimonas_sp.AAC.1